MATNDMDYERQLEAKSILDKICKENIQRLREQIRTQTGLIDDAYENPLERDIRYSNMDRLRAEIDQERILEGEQRAAAHERESSKSLEDTIQL